MTRTATASANTNIALIKYWGKADEALTIPTTSSLSLTLGGTRTTTTVSFEEGARGADTVTIDGVRPSPAQVARVSRFLDLVRHRAGLTAPATVHSSSTVPLAAGLASSAAGFAALALAASRAAGMELDARALTRLARRGSGSAARSVLGGLVLWNAGKDDETSYAEQVVLPTAQPDGPPDLAMAVMVLTQERKEISSTAAMRATMGSSPLYPAWVESSAVDLREALAALRSGDLPRLGEVVEANALGMHAAMMASRPAIMYWTPRTLEALRAIAALRHEGMPVWATIDAGANVKALTSGACGERVAAALRERLPGVSVWLRRPGGAARIEGVTR
ncbi:diphosphomevalonate decarboxylase [Actinomyces slackii]|uniref:diphosphomevalonate decarboxylase n=1 Tax=Actinomyces slackii TaxID=52774 RepID=A0A3S4SLI9_9ACTO|nr:diphosphomevalonate decarboxylase [Actinomyces slackii]VEG75585.1 shikimate kinase [Actinomyces slackii]